MSDDPWPLIHAERRALAGDLAGLDPARWATASLCADWTVHQVLGHLVATAKLTPTRFARALAAAGFSFTKFTAKGVCIEAAGDPQQTLAEFHEHLLDTTAPPGPAEAMLGEIVIHAADIRRPLRLSHDYPVEALVRVADFFAGSNALLGAKRRIAGFALSATDVAWSHGAGPPVRGPLLSLILLMTGRRCALEDLSGSGASMLAARP